jgi:hypothetical protein
VNRLTGIALLLCCSPVLAQEPAASVKTLASGLGRIEGKEAVSGIAYARVFLTGTLGAAGSANAAPVAAIDLMQPTLTVQCTQAPNGKFHFEMFVNFGGVTDVAFYPPWHPASAQDLFAPQTEKVNLTMEFLGYTKVKPMTRQFEKVVAPVGQLRYNSPSGGSRNMEEAAFYFQYLRALPTFHVSGDAHTATFATAPLLAQIHNEALCRASGL